MVPSKLVQIRESTTESGEEKVEFVTVHGLAETPPRLGERFVLMTNENPPKVVKTGIIEMIEWIGQYEKQKEECLFHTSSSTYRWHYVSDG